jgi:diacylglycerol kinase (ATP)
MEVRPGASPPRPPRTVGLVTNPTAGGGWASSRSDKAVASLTRLGVEVRRRTTAWPGEARALARELAGRVDAVAVLGGDGTVNEVVNGLAGTGVPLGIIPGGTVNVLAAQLGLPFEPEAACAIIAAGRRTTMDLGSLNGRYFILHVGAGIDALTVREIKPKAKRRFREAAFVATGVQAYLRYPQPLFRVVVDGEEWRARFAVVANFAAYAGRHLHMASHADPQDGTFDVVLYQGASFARSAAFWMGMPFGLHTHHPDAATARGREVVMEPLEDGDVVWLQTDGEPAGRLPGVARVEPGVLDVFVGEGPKRTAGQREASDA